jgi:phosphatidylinositol glycan class A protein
LFVVSTKVGGVPEILPEDMIEFARADEEDVIRALSLAIRSVERSSSPHPSNNPRLNAGDVNNESKNKEEGQVGEGKNEEGQERREEKELVEEDEENGQWIRHRRVREMYDWQSVAERTEVVYNRVMELPQKDVGERLAR